MNVSASVAAPDGHSLSTRAAAPPDLPSELRAFAPIVPSRTGKDAETTNSFQSLFGCLLPRDAGEAPDQDPEQPADSETKTAPWLVMPVSITTVAAPPLSTLPGATASTQSPTNGTDVTETAKPVALGTPAIPEHLAPLWQARVTAPNAFGQPEASHASRLPLEAIVHAADSDGSSAHRALAFAARLVPSAAAEAAPSDRSTADIQDTRDAQPSAAAKPPAVPAAAGPSGPQLEEVRSGGDDSAEDRTFRSAPGMRTGEEAKRNWVQAEGRRERTDASATGDKLPQVEAAASQNNATPAPTVLRNTERVEVWPGKEAPAQPLEAESHAAPVRPAAPIASPARDISLHVAADGGERVELRVTDRAGEVRVAVRTADSDLAGSLREHLPELVHRLERSGFEAETWRPAQSGSASFDHRQTPRGAASDSYPDAQHGHPQQGEQRDRRQQQPDRARWVEEIEGSFAPSSERKPWLHL